MGRFLERELRLALQVAIAVLGVLMVGYGLGLVKFESGTKLRTDSWKCDWVVRE